MMFLLQLLKRAVRIACVLIAVWSLGTQSCAEEMLDEQELAQIRRQAVEQQIAEKVMPFVSGFVFAGLDPESTETSSHLVYDKGRLFVVSGELIADEDRYAFRGARQRNADGWLGNPVNRLMLMALFKWASLSAIIGWPFVAFVLRGTMYVDDVFASTMGSRFFRGCGWIANLMVMVVMTVLFLLSVRRPELWPTAPNLELSHLRPLITFLAAMLALGLLGSVIAWSKPYWRLPGRIHYTLTILSGVGFLWYLYQSNVLPTVFGYSIG